MMALHKQTVTARVYPSRRGRRRRRRLALTSEGRNHEKFTSVSGVKLTAAKTGL